MSNDYSVDDILLEYEMKTAKKATPKAAEPTAPATEQPRKEAARPVSATPKPQPPLPATEKFKAPAVQTTTIRMPVAQLHAEEPVSAQTRTRVLTAQTKERDTRELPSVDQLDGQLVFEHFVEPTVDEEEMEAQLQQARQEKIKGFHLIPGGKQAGFKLTGEEEAETPDEEPIEPESDAEAEELEDFNEYAEAQAVQSELSYRRRTGAIGTVLTGLMSALLIVALVLYTMGQPAAVTPTVLLSANLVLLVGMAALNHRLIANGLKGLFTFHADAESPVAVMAVVGILHTALQFGWQEQVANGSALLIASVAGFGLFAGALGRQFRMVRIARNFSFEGAPNVKKLAARFIEDEKTAMEIDRGGMIDGVPQVVYYQRASFLTHFLEHSYEEDFADRVMRWYTPLSIGVSLLCAGAYAWLHPETTWQYAPTVFAASLCLATPIWGLAALQRPLLRACKRVLRRGGMLCGWRSAEVFGGNTGAVIVSAEELFPAEKVKLHGIKTFSGTRIDEAIIDAAAVVIAAGGPLSPIFHRVIENRTDILQPVDSLAYEQDMGLSGWVGGRRVLVGSRRLLENHGVEVPTKEYEAHYTKDGRCAVYLSTGGELSAMFVVSYLADAAIAQQLAALQKEKIRLLVRTCDPNITAQRLCEVMGLREDYVQVLSAAAGRTYEALQNNGEEDTRADALLAAGGRAIAKLCALVQCSRLRKGGKAAVISQLVGGIAGLAFAAFISATTGTVLAPMDMLLYFLLLGVVAWLLPRCFLV